MSIYFNKQLKDKKGKMVFTLKELSIWRLYMALHGETLHGSAVVFEKRHLNLDTIEFIKGK